MSSGFVSGGTTDSPIQRDDEWLEAQKEIEANRRRKEEEARQEGGKTLYEVLQNNKAAKQEAFEESIRLKNQFRNLDEDEVEFLDSVLESTRAKEAAVKKETTEQLDIFRRQQEEADKALLEEPSGVEGPDHSRKAGSPTAGESSWALNARKRKRVKEEGRKGIKLRKSSSAHEGAVALIKEDVDNTLRRDQNENPSSGFDSKANIDGNANAKDLSPSAQGTTKASSSPPTSIKAAQDGPAGLGLAGYSSDEDE